MLNIRLHILGISLIISSLLSGIFGGLYWRELCEQRAAMNRPPLPAFARAFTIPADDGNGSAAGLRRLLGRLGELGYGIPGQGEPLGPGVPLIPVLLSIGDERLARTTWCLSAAGICWLRVDSADRRPGAAPLTESVLPWEHLRESWKIAAAGLAPDEWVAGAALIDEAEARYAAEHGPGESARRSQSGVPRVWEHSASRDVGALHMILQLRIDHRHRLATEYGITLSWEPIGEQFQAASHEP